MTYNIRKAAVIGSGTMGSGIASLLAGIGIPVTLLDIAAKGTQPGDKPSARNAIVAGNLKTLQKSRPPQLFSETDLELIRAGNLDDNLEWLADADWVIEVVVEKLDVKKSLMARLVNVVKPNALVTTNTSGLPINAIAEGLSDDFTRRFLGTHFFNPPRYLHLLEVIPHQNTDPAALAYLTEFATTRLGKGVVLCKDEPNFIGNRFMTMTSSHDVAYALDNGFTVEEVDEITGPLIGRPKTATFRLNDLVGTDVAVFVARNVYPAIPNDPAREVIMHPKAKALYDTMMERGWFGNKSGQGFYKMQKGAGGEKEFWPLNLDKLEYQPPTKIRFDSVGKHRKVEDTGTRIKLMMAEEDRAGKLLWHLHAFYLAYASNRVPEITETIVNVDNAQKWGFSHELGPFEIWDAIGVAETIEPFEAAGYPVADWVKQMVASGHSTFYQRNEHGDVVGYYSPQQAAYTALDADPRLLTVEGLRARKVRTASGERSAEVARNAGASVIDIGDGVALLEFHSKQNTIDNEVLEMAWKAVELLETDFDALVIGNDGERFSIGANLFLMAMAVQAGQLGDIEKMIRSGQNVTQAFRLASKPVVSAPFNMALGGGVEMFLGGARTVAYAELYAGLVEVGVGVIPAFGGCKEMLRRVVNPVMETPNADVLPHLQKAFQNIAMAKVSGSAREAWEMGLLWKSDKIVMNRSHLLWEAKRAALDMVPGYTPLKPQKIWAAGRDAYAALLIGIEGFRDGGYATEYDAHISRKLAYVLTGGALSAPGWVDEQVILDLECEAFLSLLGEQKTIDRISHMLQTNKPLRN